MVKTNTAGIWDDLRPSRRYELIAYCHAKSTMESWESYVAEKRRKKRG